MLNVKIKKASFNKTKKVENSPVVCTILIPKEWQSFLEITQEFPEVKLELDTINRSLIVKSNKKDYEV